MGRAETLPLLFFILNLGFGIFREASSFLTAIWDGNFTDKDFLKSVLTVSTTAVKLYVCTLFKAGSEPPANYHYIWYLRKSQGFTLIYQKFILLT